MSEAILHDADRAAYEKMASTEPVWDAIVTGAEGYGHEANLLLHAGPPFASVDTISRPILNSACVAAVYEGLAAEFDTAEAMIRSGEIRLEPAQDSAVVTPLATVVSASMPQHRVHDRNYPANVVHAPLNGGMRAPMRLGLRSEAVLEHIRWLNGPWAELIAGALDQPIAVIPIAAGALRRGDDCHGRTPAGTQILMAEVEQALAGVELDANQRDFCDNSPPLFLNLWMAASKCLMLAADGIADSSFVTAAAGNGVEAGIQVGGLPGRWFQTPASPPNGRFDVDLGPERALPAIGDSAVVEALGLGAMALQLSPEQEQNFADFLPADYRERAGCLLCGPHPGFGDLDCPLGLTARAVSAIGKGPIIGLGILDISGERGRLGGGIYDMPATVFDAAVAALDA